MLGRVSDVAEQVLNEKKPDVVDPGFDAEVKNLVEAGLIGFVVWMDDPVKPGSRIQSCPAVKYRDATRESLTAAFDQGVAALRMMADAMSEAAAS
jgi:hypothetical protein